MSQKTETDLLDALETIANMPAWQEGVSMEALKLQYDETRRIADKAICDCCNNPDQETEALPGYVVEIGDIKALNGLPGLVIKCDRSDLAAYAKNIIFSEVLIYPKEDRT